MSNLLAIETSQRVAGVALRARSGSILIEPLSPRKRHDDDLMPAIDRLFQRAGLAPNDLKAVGVSIGPGGFTGLRIAIATAKMFAEALNVQLVAVPSALVAAESWSSSRNRPPQLQLTPDDEIIIALASKADAAWCTRLQQHDDGEWRIVGTPGLKTVASVDLTGVHVLLGDEYLPQTIRDRCTDLDVKVIEPTFDPSACLNVATRLLGKGEVVDPLKLEPLYPREPEAVTLWESRQEST